MNTALYALTNFIQTGLLAVTRKGTLEKSSTELSFKYHFQRIISQNGVNIVTSPVSLNDGTNLDAVHWNDLMPISR